MLSESQLCNACFCVLFERSYSRDSLESIATLVANCAIDATDVAIVCARNEPLELALFARFGELIDTSTLGNSPKVCFCR